MLDRASIISAMYNYFPGISNGFDGITHIFPPQLVQNCYIYNFEMCFHIEEKYCCQDNDAFNVFVNDNIQIVPDWTEIESTTCKYKVGKLTFPVLANGTELQIDIRNVGPLKPVNVSSHFTYRNRKRRRNYQYGH